MYLPLHKPFLPNSSKTSVCSELLPSSLHFYQSFVHLVSAVCCVQCDGLVINFIFYFIKGSFSFLVKLVNKKQILRKLLVSLHLLWCPPIPGLGLGDPKGDDEWG